MEVQKKVLLTGASSGIGKAIAKRLLEEGFEVYGVGRNFREDSLEIRSNPLFHAISCDLLEDSAGEKIKQKVLADGRDIDVLINNAGTAYYGLHENIRPEEIHEMVRLNLEVPMVLSRLFLPSMKKRKKGDIVQIASVTALSSENPHGAAYGATKAGLLSFSRSLFSECRKCGIRVSTILPDMTDTDLYRNADFTADPETGAHLDPDEVADCVWYLLKQPEGRVVQELLIRPQFHRIRRKQ
ncbi:MAG: SDR family NAD(P)-dependent oxidoreductase [Lachnospiraceae bacterium]|nr:SDR family NAD(P)-dependent oxidoreductase [Lachnospiraceae bacterium]